MDWINECWMFSPSKLKRGIPHKDFTFPLWSFQPTLPVSHLPTMLQDMLPCSFAAVSLPDRLALTISAKILLPNKKMFDGMPWAPRKGVYGKSGNDYLGPWDEAEHQHWCQGRHTRDYEPGIQFSSAEPTTHWTIFLISLQVPHMHESRKKVMLSNWSTRKAD